MPSAFVFRRNPVIGTDADDYDDDDDDIVAIIESVGFKGEGKLQPKVVVVDLYSASRSASNALIVSLRRKNMSFQAPI